MRQTCTIAKHDFRQALRNRLTWGATALLAVLFLPSAAVANAEVYALTEAVLRSAFDLVTFAVLVTAAVGYKTVVGERARGTIRFLLGLPATRREIVLGKLLARVAIVGFALAVVLSIATVLSVRAFGVSSLAPFLVMVGWLLVYGAVWTAVAVGYSAAFDSEYRTLGALVVTYVTFSFDFSVWGTLVRPAFALVFTGSVDVPAGVGYESLATAPLWLRVAERLNPLVNFWQALRWSVEFVGPETPTGSPLPHAVGTVLFLLFGVLVVSWGTRRFERADLGDETSGFGPGEHILQAINGVTALLPRNWTETTTGESDVKQIVRADRRHALQNWVVVAGLTVTLLLVGPGLWQLLRPSSVDTLAGQFADIAGVFNLSILILGIAIGYGAVAGERARGTARFVLGLPATRRDLVVGKLRSRLTLVTVALLVVIAVSEVLVAVQLGGILPLALLAWGSYALVLGSVWTSVVVGFSAALSTRYRTLAAAFGTFLVFGRDVGLWNLVFRPGFAWVFTGRTEWDDYAFAADGGPLWFRYTDHLNPFVALETLYEGLLTAAGYRTQFADATFPLVCYSLLVLVAFAAIPVVLGYRRFERTDL